MVARAIWCDPIRQNIKIKIQINMCFHRSSSGHGDQPISWRDSFAQFLNKMAAWVLFLCVAASLVAVVIFAYGKSIVEEDKDVKITYVFQTDTLGVVTPASRMFADSVLHEMSKHEQRIADKYEYIIEQRSNIEDYLTWGGILLTIVVSVFGFFGYKSLHDIEGKLVKQIEPSAQKAAEDKAASVCENKYEAYQTTAESKIEAWKTIAESKIESFQSSTYTSLRDDLTETMGKKVAKQKQNIDDQIRTKVQEEYNQKFADRVQDIENNTSIIESLQKDVTELKGRLDDMTEQMTKASWKPNVEKKSRKSLKSVDPDPMNNPQNA